MIQRVYFTKFLEFLCKNMSHVPECSMNVVYCNSIG